MCVSVLNYLELADSIPHLNFTDVSQMTNTSVCAHAEIIHYLSKSLCASFSYF